MTTIAIHPGEHLQDELTELQMSAEDLAEKLGVPPAEMHAILRGERDVDADSALRLGHFFGMSAQFWMNLQSRYALIKAEAEFGTLIDRLPTLEKRRAA